MSITPITIKIHNNAYARFHQIFCRFTRMPVFHYVYAQDTMATFWSGEQTERIYIHLDDFNDFHLATDIPIPDYNEVITILKDLE